MKTRSTSSLRQGRAVPQPCVLPTPSPLLPSTPPFPSPLTGRLRGGAGGGQWPGRVDTLTRPPCTGLAASSAARCACRCRLHEICAACCGDSSFLVRPLSLSSVLRAASTHPSPFSFPSHTHTHTHSIHCVRACARAQLTSFPHSPSPSPTLPYSTPSSGPLTAAPRPPSTCSRALRVTGAPPALCVSLRRVPLFCAQPLARCAGGVPLWLSSLFPPPPAKDVSCLGHAPRSRRLCGAAGVRVRGAGAVRVRRVERAGGWSRGAHDTARTGWAPL